MLIELDPVDRITADAIGPPGQRAFFLQGRKDDQVVTLLVEKQQVQLLAASVVEILSRLGKDTGEGPPDEEMQLEEPVVPSWRAGRISIGYEEERDLILLEAEELVQEPDDEASEEVDEDDPLSALGVELEVTALSTEEEAGVEDQPGLEGTIEEELQALEELERLEAGAGLRPEGGEDERGEEPSKVRFWATREQMLSLARHGASVCAAGRPRCHLCGNSIDPEGHQCPGLNGHRDAGR